jgi:hypothetical protein
MKKKHGMVLCALIFLGAGLVSAQGRAADRWLFPGEAAERVKIGGKLGFVNGYIALESESITYYIHGLGQLIGFVEGLKEGAQVELEGRAVGVPDAPGCRYFLAEKLVFNGKEYDKLRPSLPRPPQRPNPPGPGRQGPRPGPNGRRD